MTGFLAQVLQFQKNNTGRQRQCFLAEVLQVLGTYNTERMTVTMISGRGVTVFKNVQHRKKDSNNNFKQRCYRF